MANDDAIRQQQRDLATELERQQRMEEQREQQEREERVRRMQLALLQIEEDKRRTRPNINLLDSL